MPTNASPLPFPFVPVVPASRSASQAYAALTPTPSVTPRTHRTLHARSAVCVRHFRQPASPSIAKAPRCPSKCLVRRASDASHVA